MSLEDMYREYLVVPRRRARRKLKKLELSRKAQEKKEKQVAGPPVTQIKKAVKEPHWCSWCDTIGHQCGRR